MTEYIYNCAHTIQSHNKSIMKYMNLSMKQNLFVAITILIFALPNSTTAQKTGYMELLGQVQFEDQKVGLDGASIRIYKNKKFKNEVIVADSGKFILNMDYQAHYTLAFSKNGFVTKKIAFDSYVPDVVTELIFQYKFNVTLFRIDQNNNINTMLENPIAVIAFDEATEEFVHKPDYPIKKLKWKR